MKYTTPENSFMIMISLLEEYGMKEWFKSGMVGLRKDYYILLCLQKKYMPALFKKMKDCNYTPPMYAMEWFLTLFSARFPPELYLQKNAVNIALRGCWQLARQEEPIANNFSK